MGILFAGANQQMYAIHNTGYNQYSAQLEANFYS